MTASTGPGISRRWGAPALPALALLLALLLGGPVAVAGAPAWVTLEGRPVLELRAIVGGRTPAGLAQRASVELKRMAEDHRLAPEQLVVRDDPPYSVVGVQQADGTFLPRLVVDDRVASAFGQSRPALAGLYRDQLRDAIRQYRSTHRLSAWLRGTALALLVLLLYLLWLRWQLALNGRLRRWLARPDSPPRVAGWRVAGARVLDEEQVRQGLQLGRQLLNGALLAMVSYLLIPLLLGFFPPTQVIAEGLRAQIRSVLVRGGEAGLNAIPNLLSIVLILAITSQVIRASNAWFRALERGRLQIPGFYPEWAMPTRRLLAGVILLAGLVIAFPYVPGSNSKVFQGAGLLVGVLAALGSSAVATNVISGLMLIYTRAFQEGDRVEIGGVVGVVQDRALLVTRIQTPRNELVSIPNATVIATSIVNFSFSTREIARPVAVATTVTIGYDVPWRQVHALLLAAARGLPAIAAQPEPYVLQTALNDFNISYELNAFVVNAGLYRETLSELLGAIQDRFAEAKVEILSPGYHAVRDGEPSTLPPWP